MGKRSENYYGAQHTRTARDPLSLPSALNARFSYASRLRAYRADPLSFVCLCLPPPPPPQCRAVNESCGIAIGILIAALQNVGIATLTSTPMGAESKIRTICGRGRKRESLPPPSARISGVRRHRRTGRGQCACIARDSHCCLMRTTVLLVVATSLFHPKPAYSVRRVTPSPN